MLYLLVIVFLVSHAATLSGSFVGSHHGHDVLGDCEPVPTQLGPQRCALDLVFCRQHCRERARHFDDGVYRVVSTIICSFFLTDELVMCNSRHWRTCPQRGIWTLHTGKVLVMLTESGFLYAVIQVKNLDLLAF